MPEINDLYLLLGTGALAGLSYLLGRFERRGRVKTSPYIDPAEVDADLHGGQAGATEKDTNPLSVWAGPFWTGETTARELGVDRSEILDALQRQNSILRVVTSDGVEIYPEWQFRQTTNHTDIWPGVAVVLSQLSQHDPWAVAVLFNTPAPELGGLTPIDWIRQDGDEDILAQFSQTVDSEWTR